MKQLVWLLLVELGDYEPENLAMVSESLLMPTLLLYIDLRYGEHPARKQWSPTQTSALQRVLCTLPRSERTPRFDPVA